MLDNNSTNISGDVAIVAGISTSCAGRADLADLVVQSARLQENGRPRLLFDVNGHAVALFHGHPGYRQAMEAADIVHADGQPIVLASRLLCKRPIAERSATTDMIFDIAERASREGLSFYLLGGDEAVNARCAEKLRQRYPDLRIAGRRHGYFDKTEEAQVAADINASGADIVWVGLGKPFEQELSVRLRDRLACGWIITCGGCFNFVAGSYTRAPRYMQALGLEWLYRLITNPRKLFWRYLTTNPVAVFWIIRRSQ